MSYRHSLDNEQLFQLNRSFFAFFVLLVSCDSLIACLELVGVDLTLLFAFTLFHGQSQLGRNHFSDPVMV